MAHFQPQTESEGWKSPRQQTSMPIARGGVRRITFPESQRVVNFKRPLRLRGSSMSPSLRDLKYVIIIAILCRSAQLENSNVRERAGFAYCEFRAVSMNLETSFLFFLEPSFSLCMAILTTCFVFKLIMKNSPQATLRTTLIFTTYYN